MFMLCNDFFAIFGAVIQNSLLQKLSTGLLHFRSQCERLQSPPIRIEHQDYLSYSE